MRFYTFVLIQNAKTAAQTASELKDDHVHFSMDNLNKSQRKGANSTNLVFQVAFILPILFFSYY
jgi:hypothetical protein